MLSCGASAARERGTGIVVLFLGLLGMAYAPEARAQEGDDEALLEPELVQIHGFVSQGFIKTSENNYLAKSERGSFEFTEAGINFTRSFNDNLRVGFQLFAHELGPLGNYSPRFDWYYLDYRFADFFGLRVGRTKIPFGLYNDSADIDAARVPILLPQSVYPIDHREYLLAQTGAEVYGNVELGALGGLEYRIYGGTLHMGDPTPPPGVTVSDLEVKYVYGGRLLWLPPLSGLTLGASYQALRFDWRYTVNPALIPAFQALQLVPADFTGDLPVEFRVRMGVASAEYQTGNLSVAVEYSRWVGEFESAAPKLLPPHIVNERYYAMVSYQVTPWFTPGVYYSAYFPNKDKRDARADYQHDVAVSFRYDLTKNWLLKLEGHWMEGTAALEESLNDKPKNQLAKEWGAFLVKTTAYF
ncbi:MAG: OprO/OprP family phosphate-selective porin [Myxococcota bacterium]|jgi:hypothetical protein|nr:OprO/OprP family phosphate-selective porin [Myxococcota bacterium]